MRNSLESQGLPDHGTFAEQVIIPGAGSGVATFLLQFAKAAGAVVYVTSRSETKCAQALALGADKAINSGEDWNQQLAGEKVDLVIESVGAATFTKSLGQLRPGGTIVTFGASAGDEVKIDIRSFFYGQIRPVIDRMYPLQQFHEAFTRMDNATQFGKIGFVFEA
ncbi:zinc-binding dehydrogenase [Aneurinibacillus sp. BA2021]|nr:zinc-binding dehydrogenase [Aneurinibacillus sp. BA2021]